MGVKTLLVLILVLNLVGCATAGKGSSVQQLQIRNSELERELQQRDEEIRYLETELKAAQKPKVDLKSTTVTKKAKIEDPAATPKKIQTALKNAGFYNGAIDGKVGKATQASIMEFQKANNLKADGIAGKKTWAKLKTYLK